MKRARIFLTMFTILMTLSPVFGQGKYGKDSAECVKYLSFYTEYMKQGNIQEAASPWRVALSYCPPSANQNMILDGMKIVRTFIGKNRNNPVRTKELVDTLLMLHDYRIEYYPRYAVKAKENKALDMINYYKNDDKFVFDAIEEAMKASKGKTNNVLLVRYMGYAQSLYEAGKMSDEDVLNAFNLAMEYADMVEAEKPGKEIQDTKADIEKILISSGVADCDRLVALFTPKYEANPNDLNQLKGIVSLLTSTECLDTDLFLKSLNSLYHLDPSSKTAYILYSLYSSHNEHNSALKYLQEAIDCEDSDDKQDCEYYLEMSSYYYKKLANSTEAIKNAKKAATNSEVAGRAYLLIGTIWGSTKCSGNEIEQRSPYWVAVDYLTKAKNVDSSLATEVNNMIKTYSQYFPMQADAFMYDLLDGQSYTVSCAGMRETTTVRTQK